MTDHSDYEQWVAKREARLHSATGYLAIAGMYWLQEGDNSFGSAEQNDLVFPPGKAPAKAGVLHLAGGEVSIQPASGVTLLHAGEPIAPLVLQSDVQGEPTKLQLGELTFWVIERAGKIGVRLLDAKNPILQNYTATPRFPYDSAWRVAAEFQPFATPKKVMTPNVLGTFYEEECLGQLVFTIQGITYRLEPTGNQDDMSLIFGDKTNGVETYGGGRFLPLPPIQEQQTIILDFNKSYNPPCAYNPYTTCPLPTKQNRLPIPIPAGEKVYLP